MGMVMQQPIRNCRRRRFHEIRGARIALGLWTCLLAAPAWAADELVRPAAGEPAAAEQFGQMIRISLPLLDDRAVSLLRPAVQQALDKARARGVRPVLIFEFDVRRGAGEGGRGSRFGDAYELAKFLSGEELNAATTVAYLPQSIQGHAVLAALACDQIIMAETATIGAAGVDEETIDETCVGRLPRDRRPAADLAGGAGLGNAPPGRRRLDGPDRSQHGVRHRRPAWRNCGSTTPSNRNRC